MIVANPSRRIMISAVIESGMFSSLLVGLVTAYEDACTRSRRIVKSAVTETSIVKGSLKTTTRYLHAVDMTSTMKTKGQPPPLQANNEEHHACLEESVSLQIQEGEH